MKSRFLPFILIGFLVLSSCPALASSLLCHGQDGFDTFDGFLTKNFEILTPNSSTVQETKNLVFEVNTTGAEYVGSNLRSVSAVIRISSKNGKVLHAVNTTFSEISDYMMLSGPGSRPNYGAWIGCQFRK